MKVSTRSGRISANSPMAGPPPAQLADARLAWNGSRPIGRICALNPLPMWRPTVRRFRPRCQLIHASGRTRVEGVADLPPAAPGRAVEEYLAARYAKVHRSRRSGHALGRRAREDPSFINVKRDPLVYATHPFNGTERKRISSNSTLCVVCLQD